MPANSLFAHGAKCENYFRGFPQSDPDEQLLNTTNPNEIRIPKFITNPGSYITSTKSKARISSSRVCLDRIGQYFTCTRTYRRNCLNNFERATETWNNSVSRGNGITGRILRLRRGYFRTNSFVITSMVTYSTRRECAVVLQGGGGERGGWVGA